MSPRVVLPPGLSPAAPRVAVAVPRRVAAGILRAASRLLDRIAQRLAALPALATAADEVLPSFEFHADAGAPEGALYVDGQLVGFVPGVARL